MKYKRNKKLLPKMDNHLSANPQINYYKKQ